MRFDFWNFPQLLAITWWWVFPGQKGTCSCPPKYPPSTLKQQCTFNVLNFPFFWVVVGNPFDPCVLGINVDGFFGYLHLVFITLDFFMLHSYEQQHRLRFFATYFMLNFWHEKNISLILLIFMKFMVRTFGTNHNVWEIP